MAETTTLNLKNDTAELERVMAFISDLCARHSVPADLEYDLNLALDEIVTNVAKHAFPEGSVHDFTLQVSLSKDEFTAWVEDDGIAFNPIDHPVPNLDAPLEERRGGGLGIFLVRQIMTSIEYRRVDGKNLLTLRKKLN